MTDNIEVLLSQTNVYQYPSKPVESIVDDLVDQRIRPRLSVVSSPGSDATGLYTLWRSSSANQSSEDYVFVLNNGTKATFTLQFNIPTTDVVPYIFDAWKGSQEPIAVYETNDDEFRIPVRLEQFQSRFVAFIQSDAATGRHVLSHSENIAEIRATPPGLEAYIVDAKTAGVVLSDRNETVVIPEVAGPLPTVGELGPWNPDLITGPDFDEFGLVGPVVGQVLRRVTVL